MLNFLCDVLFSGKRTAMKSRGRFLKIACNAQEAIWFSVWMDGCADFIERGSGVQAGEASWGYPGYGVA
jgi:hypothetical protein